MSSKKNNKPKNVVKKDEKISSVIEVKEKDNKIVYVLILVVAILASFLVYFAFFNKCSDNCEKCENSTIEIEVEPNYQLVNYVGFKFKMPLDWDFVGDLSYTISDKDESIFISFDSINYDFESFTSDEIQKNFLESLQTSDNIKIDKSTKQDDYYLYEGTFNNYNFLIIAIGDSKKIVLVKTQFVDKVAYEKLKDNVIEFAKSGIQKAEG